MRKSILAIMSLGFVLGACDDTAGPEGDQLSRAEALRLAALVLASSEGAATGSMTMTGGATTAGEAGGPPVEFTRTHESTVPCPSGGELAIQFVLSGTIDEDTQSLQAGLDGSQVHNGCAFPHNGLTMTVDGDPSIGFAMSIGAVNGEPSQPFTFSLDGRFRWGASDGRAGGCSLSLDAVTDFAAQQRTVHGNVCGHSFNDSLSWS